MNNMRRFIGYRPTPPEDYVAKGAANAPDEPQYEGIVFSDGTVCIRWLTEYRSHSIWKNYDTFYQIHGHPEYGTIIKWLDEDKQLISDRIKILEDNGFIYDPLMDYYINVGEKMSIDSQDIDNDEQFNKLLLN